MKKEREEYLASGYTVFRRNPDCSEQVQNNIILSKRKYCFAFVYILFTFYGTITAQSAVYPTKWADLPDIYAFSTGFDNFLQKKQNGHILSEKC